MTAKDRNLYLGLAIGIAVLYFATKARASTTGAIRTGNDFLDSPQPWSDWSWWTGQTKNAGNSAASPVLPAYPGTSEINPLEPPPPFTSPSTPGPRTYLPSAALDPALMLAVPPALAWSGIFGTPVWAVGLGTPAGPEQTIEVS